MKTTQTPKQAVAFPLVVIKQAVAVLWTLDLVPIIIGPVGFTKSASIKSLTDDLGLPIYDVRLSDKEPTDLGGIPFPVDRPDGKPGKIVTYLMTDLMPFADEVGDDHECVLFFDEVDRTSIDVLNAALQLLLDKGINGKKLSSKTHIVCAGNGVTDTGTTELTSAAATRLCHLYVDTQGPQCLDHWVDWALQQDLDPALVGFSQFRREIFAGPKHDYVELQQPNPRTFTWAAQALTQLESLPDYGPEVGDAIVFGLVGQVAGREYIAYRHIMHDCPNFSQVCDDPAAAKIPQLEQVGVIYALGSAFMSLLYDPNVDEKDKALSPEVDPENTACVAQYMARVVETHPTSREAVAWFFRMAGKKLPSLASRPEYKSIVD